MIVFTIGSDYPKMSLACLFCKWHVTIRTWKLMLY